MKFLLQSKLCEDENCARFLRSAQKFADVHFVDLLPFTNGFSIDENFRPSHSFGSTKFIQICRNKGLFIFPSFLPIESFYPKELWLNCKFRNIPLGKVKIDSPTFIKPLREKLFNGFVAESNQDLENIQIGVSCISDEKNEIVQISPARNIEAEARFFILSGKIASASIYKMNGRYRQIRIFDDYEAWEFVEKLLQQYGSIASGFVMDVGLIDKGWRIVELNNLNSSGVYDCDTDSIVKSLINVIF